MKRGEFFSKAFSLAVGKSLDLVGETALVKNLEAMAEESHRPPGAPKEDRVFRKACTGCDQCMIACPENVVMLEDMESRRPAIYPKKAACIHCADYPCIQACPTEALDLNRLSS